MNTNINDRIKKINKYFDVMNIASKEGIIYVGVQFPKAWECSDITEDNFNVKVVKDTIPGYFYFFSSLNDNLENIFDAIDFNINFNLDAETKLSLLKEKIEQLKSIFENEDINVLKTIEFKYKKKKKKQLQNNNSNNNNIYDDNNNIDNNNNIIIVDDDNYNNNPNIIK